MPLIDPVWAARLRGQWPLIGALVVLLLLLFSDQLWFRTARERYDAAVRQADEVGMAVDPSRVPEMLPPRIFALLADNSVPTAEANERASSGAMTAEFLENLTRLAARAGAEVIVTEPEPMSQQPQSIQVRAHLRLRCRYDQFVALLAEMAAARMLLSIDRFTLVPESPGVQVLELWTSRHVIKQDPGR